MLSVSKNKKIFNLIVILFYLLLPVTSWANNLTANNTDTTIQFWVDEEYDTSHRDKVSAILSHSSQNAIFYIEKDYYQRLSDSQKANIDEKIVKLAKTFDDIIYPGVLNVFGDVWSPGIDNDPRITIFFTPLNDNIGGYFNPNDEYHRQLIQGEKSNEREILYMNPDFINDPRIEGFIAHELQHMVTWNQKTRILELSEDIWLNEGRSELASIIIEEYLDTEFSKSNLYDRKNTFYTNHNDSLTDWYNQSYDYSTVSLFTQYLREQFGLSAIKHITNNPHTGIDSINYTLMQFHNNSFAEVFTNWTIANYVNNRKLSNIYGYSHHHLKGSLLKPYVITPNEKETQITLKNSIKNWSHQCYELDLRHKNNQNLNININFTGDTDGVFKVPIIIKYNTGDIKIYFIDLNQLQDGHFTIRLLNKNITTIAIIPSSQKPLQRPYAPQVENKYFQMSFDFTPTSIYTFNDGDLLRANDDEKVFVVSGQGTARQWITNAETFQQKGYQWKDIIIVTNEDLNQLSLGDHITAQNTNLEGSLVKTPEDPKVYLIQNKQRRWIKDSQTFAINHFKWNDIIQITTQELDSYQKGSNIQNCLFDNNSLIKTTEDRVYVINNCQAKWITSPEVFQKKNYQWSKVVTVSPQILNKITPGSDIKF